MIKMCIPRRFYMMIVMSFFVLGFFSQYYCPSAVENYIMKEMELSTFQYSTLCSVAVWASLLDVVNSVIIEKWLSMKLATLIYMAVILIGNAIFILSAFMNSFWLMVTGRLVFGLGGNPMFMCINVFIIHWFAGKEMRMMFSTVISVIWLGSSFAYTVSIHLLLKIKTYQGINDFMSLVLTLSIFTIILTIMMELSAGTIIYQYCKDIAKTKKEEKPSSPASDIVQHERRSIKSLLTYHPIFWTFTFSSFLYFMTVTSFTIMIQNLLTTKYQMTTLQSSDIATVYTIIVFIVAPPLGYIADYFGRGLIFCTVGVILGMTAHSLLLFTMINPLYPIIMLSVSAAFSSFNWGLLSFLVKEYQFVVAFGIAQTGVNFAIAVGSIVSGYIVQKNGYNALILFYLVLMSCSTALMLVVWIFDRQIGRPLSMSAAERKFKSENFNETRKTSQDTLSMKSS